MEDYRLPASLVGMLKVTRLTGIPRIQTATLAVTITWELASYANKKKTTKPLASKKTAPAKKKKSPSPSTESSEPPKSSTPPPSPKPTPPPSPKPTPAPSPPQTKPSPKPTLPSPKKANRLHENVQRLTKVATRRLARQGGLTPEPNPTTQQPSAPCPEVLPPQVTARRVGPPPTAVSSQTTAESYAGRPSATETHTTGTTQLPRQGLPAVSKQGQQTRQSVRSQRKQSRDRRLVQQTQREAPALRQVLSIYTEKLCTEGA